MRQRYHRGDKVQMAKVALENYGQKYAGVEFAVSRVAIAYMPAEKFYAQGQPEGYYPGFDYGAGCALYDLTGLNFSLYDWELV